MKTLFRYLVLFTLGCASLAQTAAAPFARATFAQAESEAIHKPTSFLQSEREKFAAYRPHDVYACNCVPGKLIAAAQVNAAATRASCLPVNKIFNARDPHQYLIFIATDGTGKDASNIFSMDDDQLIRALRDAAKSQEECLHPAHPDSRDAAQSYPSNPALLARSLQRAGHRHVRVVYVRGVGADPQASTEENLKNAATGDTLAEQINTAFGQTKIEVAAIFSRDPKAKVVFATTGFSRGAAAARALHNKIMDEGFGDGEHVYIQPGAANIGVSVLFDTVITQRVDMSSELMSVEMKLHLDNGAEEIAASQYRIPKNIVQVLHITANNEYRLGFELRRAQGVNVREIAMPGAHSDIGGGYSFDGISAVTLQMAISYFSRAGIPVLVLPPEFKPDPQAFAIHDARKLPLLPFDEQIKKPRVLNVRN